MGSASYPLSSICCIV